MKRGARHAAQVAGLVRYSTGKPCSHGHMSERYTVNTLCCACAEDKQHTREYMAEWRKNNPAKLKKYARRFRLKDSYGLTLEEVDKMAESQDNKCGICGREASLVVDHDHSTGDVRGMLCHRCNHGIGHFGDDVARLVMAIAYLESKK